MILSYTLFLLTLISSAYGAAAMQECALVQEQNTVADAMEKWSSYLIPYLIGAQARLRCNKVTW